MLETILIRKSAIVMNENIEYITNQKFGHLNATDWTSAIQITCQKGPNS
jgi:hypothetical protein